MYLYRDTKEDIPNNFAPDLIENKVFSIPVIIFLLDKGFMKRECVPPDVLKRVDAENAFLDYSYELHTKNHTNGDDEMNFPSKCPECLSEIAFLRYQYELRKEDIPREFVNPTLVREKVSIWDIVQLLGHGAVQVDKLPKDIQDRVYAELDRRHKIYKKKIRESKPLL